MQLGEEQKKGVLNILSLDFLGVRDFVDNNFMFKEFQEF